MTEGAVKLGIRAQQWDCVGIMDGGWGRIQRLVNINNDKSKWRIPSPARSCANYNITWHREHLCHEDSRGYPPSPSYSPPPQFLLSTHCPNDMSSCLYLCIPPPQSWNQQCVHWTYFHICYGLQNPEVSCYMLLQNTWHYLDVFVPDTRVWPVSGDHAQCVAPAGPGVTCSSHRGQYLEAQGRSGLRHGGTGQLCPGPARLSGTFHSWSGLMAGDAK